MVQATRKKYPQNYYAYITSQKWRRRRGEYLRIHPYCEKDYLNRATVVHHLCYDRLGSEPNEDLMSLCKDCHAKMHLWPSIFKAPNRLMSPANDNEPELPF